MKTSFFLIAFLIIISSINTNEFEDTIENKNKSLVLRGLRSVLEPYNYNNLIKIFRVIVETANEDNENGKVVLLEDLIDSLKNKFSKKELIDKIIIFVYENNVDLEKADDKIDFL